MRRFFYPQKDATIYQEFPERQAGLDEILEIGKSSDGLYATRALIQFDVNAISSSIIDGTIPPTAKFDLKLYVARVEKSNRPQVIETYPISESWQEGSGYFYQDWYQQIDGVTWEDRQSGSLWLVTGSSYQTTPSSSMTTAVPYTDLVFDVTNMILSWVSGTRDNQGFVFKYPSADEIDANNHGKVYVFSKDTHTVYAPIIIAKWDNQVFLTGSLSASTVKRQTVYPFNLDARYNLGEDVRVDLIVRDKYPLKTFTTQYAWTGSGYLPSSSYFSIVDVQSREAIIPFDDYSKISVDSEGVYFDFKVENMYPLRHYKVLFKVIKNGKTYIYDDNYTFTVNQ